MNDDPGNAAPESLAELASIPEKATASACFGDSTVVGDHVVIPVAEVTYGLGLGYGYGSGRSTRDDAQRDVGGGGGGGGGSHVRGVAVIHASPSGVEVHPIRDETAITLASIALAATAVAIVARTLLKLIRG
ncbi:MAG: spore germination protein GerW family protein [Chloroflexi bacterium]|nr:spore germination protein GerW family protein [Chloroflexota bacterium]